MEEVAKANGVTIMGEARVFIPVLNYRPKETSFVDENIRLVKGFIRLCRGFAFDPVEKPGARYRPNLKGVSRECRISEDTIFESRKLFRAANNEIQYHLAQEKDMRAVKRSRRRARTGTDLARSIIYILEKFKGDADALELVADYFKVQGQFERDLQRTMVVFDRAIRRLRGNSSFQKAMFDFDKKTVVPKYMHNLVKRRQVIGVSSIGKGSNVGRTTWANLWKQDLSRVVISEGLPEIEKSLRSKEAKEKLMAVILKEGDGAIKKNRVV